MFNIHRKLFLALKKVQIVKIILLRFPLPSKNSPPSVKICPPQTPPPPLTRSLTTWEKLPQPTPNDYLENPASMDQIFCQLKKVLLLRKFQAFPPKKHFFPGCINLYEICMKFHKYFISYLF